MLLLRFLLTTVFALCNAYNQVCFQEVGCFSNAPPYDNTKGVLPDPPDGQHIILLLYNRGMRRFGVSFSYNERDLMTNLGHALFDKNKDTKFITHGFGGSPDLDWVLAIKNALLDKGDYDVIVVDWEKAAKMPDYYQAVANLRVAGAELEIFLKAMEKGGYDLSRVHLIGHSLGAQLFADAGRRMGGRIGRLTALDAASPLFEDRSPEVRLDKTDAMFVDVIHTDGDDLGIKSGAGIHQVSGHVDYFANGGRNQPGCFDHTLAHIGSIFGRKRRRRSISGRIFDFVGCSHHRSVDLFIESIKSDCAFTAYPCSDYDKYKDGECRDCSNNRCNQMGFHADPKKGMGNLYIRTNSEKAYCDPKQAPKKKSWWPFGR